MLNTLEANFILEIGTYTLQTIQKLMEEVNAEKANFGLVLNTMADSNGIITSLVHIENNLAVNKIKINDSL